MNVPLIPGNIYEITITFILHFNNKNGFEKIKISSASAHIINKKYFKQTFFQELNKKRDCETKTGKPVLKIELLCSMGMLSICSWIIIKKQKRKKRKEERQKKWLCRIIHLFQ